MSLASSGGWCAPAEVTYLDVHFGVEPERWPSGLLPEDIDWIAQMLTVAEVDVDEDRWHDLPKIGVRRGGVTWSP